MPSPDRYPVWSRYDQAGDKWHSPRRGLVVPVHHYAVAWAGDSRPKIAQPKSRHANTDTSDDHVVQESRPNGEAQSSSHFNERDVGEDWKQLQRSVMRNGAQIFHGSIGFLAVMI